MTTKVKFECMDCGCYFYVKDRNDFECPNCEYLESEYEKSENFTKITENQLTRCGL